MKSWGKYFPQFALLMFERQLNCKHCVFYMIETSATINNNISVSKHPSQHKQSENSVIARLQDILTGCGGQLTPETYPSQAHFTKLRMRLCRFFFTKVAWGLCRQ